MEAYQRTVRLLIEKRLDRFIESFTNIRNLESKAEFYCKNLVVNLNDAATINSQNFEEMCTAALENENHKFSSILIHHSLLNPNLSLIISNLQSLVVGKDVVILVSTNIAQANLYHQTSSMEDLCMMLESFKEAKSIEVVHYSMAGTGAYKAYLDFKNDSSPMLSYKTNVILTNKLKMYTLAVENLRVITNVTGAYNQNLDSYGGAHLIATTP